MSYGELFCLAACLYLEGAGLKGRYYWLVVCEDGHLATGAGHGKRAIFEQILTREGCTPRQMLVVGDNPLSELAAGRALGATTVQTVRPGVEPWPLADHQVEGLQGLLALLSADAPRAAADTPPAGAGQRI